MHTPTHDPDTFTADAAAATGGGTTAAARLTRLAAVLILAGVFAQASFAGGFLAGHANLRGIHEYVGYGLVVIAIVGLLVGVIARRSGRLPVPRIGSRIALVVASAASVLTGMRAVRGTTDLLIVHVPLAFVIAGLAVHLWIGDRGATFRRPRVSRSSRRGSAAS